MMPAYWPEIENESPNFLKESGNVEWRKEMASGVIKLNCIYKKVFCSRFISKL